MFLFQYSLQPVAGMSFSNRWRNKCDFPFRTAKSNLSVSIMADYEDLEEKLKVPVYPNPMVAVMRCVPSHIQSLLFDIHRPVEA